jgi:hypothetical protein
MKNKEAYHIIFCASIREAKVYADKAGITNWIGVTNSEEHTASRQYTVKGYSVLASYTGFHQYNHRETPLSSLVRLTHDRMLVYSQNLKTPDLRPYPVYTGILHTGGMRLENSPVIAIVVGATTA